MSWQQLGSDLDGESAFDFFGESVSMSVNGNRLVVGAKENGLNNSGYVRVYEWSGTDWLQLGPSINGESDFNWFGYSVSMSGDGNRIAVGAPGNHGKNNLWESGQVLIYEWSGENWIHLGESIDGEAKGDGSGHSVSLSTNGNRIAIGAKYNDDTDEGAGHVRVFEWSGSAWVQIGNDIDGEAFKDNFGIAVSLSKIGDRVAIGAADNDGSAPGAGHVRVYEFFD
jgi:hypothetical protein